MHKGHKGKFAPPESLLLHIMRNFVVATILVVIALYIGMLGYHVFEKMSWVDSFLNASMILSGMGPAADLVTTAGKIFAGCYALFSGLAFISIMVIIFSPFIRKFFHRIHVET
ncbi:MAG: hypothetical protein WC627_02905 [Legionella sp.]|jgi:hypothetical protein